MEQMWQFQIGGYQILDKWLKGRKGEVLTKEELDGFSQILAIIAYTITQMKAIDVLVQSWI
jgi:hypothetical protein